MSGKENLSLATIISNQATVNYRFGTTTAEATSNVATTSLEYPLSIEKASLSRTYRIGDNLTYIITVVNNGNNALESVSVVDDLGTFVLNGNEITPLDFSGEAYLYVNGILRSEITPVIEDNGIVFEIEDIPANSNAQIIYQARVNDFACFEAGGAITNTSTAVNNCDCICDGTSEASNTVVAEEYAEVRIIKSVCPNPVICGEELTFVFDIYNYGNVEATNVVLRDTFVPPLENISVRIDGNEVAESDYSYTNGVLILPDASGDEITIPAAECTRDPATGVVSRVPGSIRITISGVAEI